MIKTLRNTGLTLLALHLVACASPPRTVDASLPLVESQRLTYDEVVPAEYWARLDDAKESEFTHNEYRVRLGYPYESALGTTCRLMYFFEDSNQAFVGSRIACVDREGENDSLWFLTNNVSDKETSVGLQ